MDDLTRLTPADLKEPNLTTEFLGRVASGRPDLRFAVLSHPNCSSELERFIRCEDDAPQSKTVARDSSEAHAGFVAPLTLLIVTGVGFVSLFLPVVRHPGARTLMEMRGGYGALALLGLCGGLLASLVVLVWRGPRVTGVAKAVGVAGALIALFVAGILIMAFVVAADDSMPLDMAAPLLGVSALVMLVVSLKMKGEDGARAAH